MKTELYLEYESPLCTTLEMAPAEILCSSSESDENKSTESFGFDSDYLLS